MQDDNVTPGIPPFKSRTLNGGELLSLVGDAVICADELGRIVFFNAAAEESFGFSAKDVHGQSVEMLLPERYRIEHRLQVRKFAAEQGDTKRVMGHRRQVWARRKTGEEFPVEAIVSRQTLSGRTYVAVALRDATEHNRIEQDHELVARELNHRVKNVIAVINSLVTLSSKGAEDVGAFTRSLQDRLNALGATHDLVQNAGGESASFSDLLQTELAQYRGRGGANLGIAGPQVIIGRSAALALALAFHELATNSAKYGALSSPTGRVDLAWDKVQEGDKAWLSIGWRESGGPPVSPPKRRGFGTTLIDEAIRRTFRAEVALDYAPNGLVCRMKLPLENIEPRG